MESLKNKTYNKPDFICVGLHKCGTTWLNHQLKQHPEIRMPIIKELRFFLEGERIPNHSYTNLIFSKAWHYRSMRRQFFKRFFPNKRLRKNGLKKMFAYYFRRHTLDWYVRNFDEYFLSGDVTPGYYAISDKRIDQIKRHFPDVKIIVMLRDPVSRLWSNYKMNVKNQERLDDLNNVSIHQKNIQRLIEATLSYVHIVERWRSRFEHVGVFYYNQVRSNPDGLMKDIYRFIGCKDPDFSNPNLSKILNPGQKTPIPRKLERDLAGVFLPEMEKLVEYTDHEIPKKWVIEYQEILSKNTEN